MNDAEVRLAERFVTDLERVLGPGIAVQDLEIVGDGPVTIRVACLIDGTMRTILATGESTIDALGDAMRKAAETRLGAALGHLIGPT